MTFGQLRRPVPVLALLLLALCVLRPGVNGLRKRIVSSVSLALGRKVDVERVRLELLPQPGFDLVNFVVHDDPTLSAEPILRADEVTAVLRLRSLLRGRMEIGRLSLKEPSLNLVRGGNGHWNIESLIERAAHTQAAPTRNTLPERRPVFPYIQANNGRINFKIGLEKKSYSLTDADFALWLESDNQWGMRMTAQPVRTDFNLTDTGTLRVSGTWQRSPSLAETPLKFTLRWDRAQMGELTKLLYGEDMGWRGSVMVAADFYGRPADLKVQVRSSVDDFRRYDIVTERSLRLATSCEAHYSSVEHTLTGLTCLSPIGQGLMTVEGRIGSSTGPGTFDLNIEEKNVPAQALVELARRVEGGLPEDLSAAGTVTANFSVASSPAPGQALRWSGSGLAEDLVLRLADDSAELALGSVPFGLHPMTTSEPGGGDSIEQAHSAIGLALGPLTLSLGKQSLVVVEGLATPSAYRLTMQGEGSIPRLLETAQIAGLQVPRVTAEGTAKFNLVLAGKWSAHAPSRATGTAQLRSIRAQMPGLTGAVDIRSADLVLDNDTVHANRILASAAGSNWEGSLSFPRPCHLLSGCPIHFELRADEIARQDLLAWISPRNRKWPWYHLVEGGNYVPTPWRVLDLDGTLAVKRVEMDGIEAHRVSSNLSLHDGVLALSELTAEVWGGGYRSEWKANLNVSPPKVSSSGQFEHVALAQLAAAMDDGWISGTAKGSYRFSSAFGAIEDWFASGHGALHFEMRDGSLPHIVMPSSVGPLRVRRFSGQLLCEQGRWALAEGKLDSGSRIYQVSGTAVAEQKLAMKLASPDGDFLIEGTLAAPHVVSVKAPDTRAALKP